MVRNGSTCFLLLGSRFVGDQKGKRATQLLVALSFHYPQELQIFLGWGELMVFGNASKNSLPQAISIVCHVEFGRC